MGQQTTTNRSGVIFISHRPADQKIADRIVSTLKDWDLGQILICQSNDNPPNTHLRIPEQERNSLVLANVVFLIYTVSDQDWYYCMWESGLATDPAGLGTKLVIFQCAPNLPPSLPNHTSVMLNELSIKKFTWDFHKNPTFFPGITQAIAPDIGEREITARSNDLLMGLQALTPDLCNSHPDNTSDITPLHPWK